MTHNNKPIETKQKTSKSNSIINIMKKQFLLAFVFILGFGMAQAQPETQSAQDSVEIEIEGNNITVDADALENLSLSDLNKVIKEVVGKTSKIQMKQKAMLRQIELKEKAGEITPEQAEEQRDEVNERAEESMENIEDMMETWGEAYGERWESWAEEFEGKMEAWEAQVDANEDPTNIPPMPAFPPFPIEGNVEAAPADTSKKKKPQKIIISEDGITIKEGKEGDRPFALEFEGNMNDDEDKDKEVKTDKIDRTVGYSDINFGFNQLLEDGQYQLVDEPAEQEFWNSTTFELGGGWKTRLGSPYSKFYLKYGGEFSWHNFRLKGNNVISKVEGTTAGTTGAMFGADSNSISKSRFEIVYFNVPVMLQLDLSDVGDVDESFTIGVGGYAGARITARRRLEFKDFEGSDVESEIKNDFFSNSIRYGAMAQVGWGNFKLTAKYDLNTFFEQDKDFNKNFQMASVAFGWSF